MKPADRFADPEPIICCVCRRASYGLGHAARGRKPIWICDNVACIKAGAKVYRMTEKEFTGHELFARRKAGDAGGQYLDGIGKTDLATLSDEEFLAFITAVIEGFGTSMRQRILGDEAPF